VKKRERGKEGSDDPRRATSLPLSEEEKKRGRPSVRRSFPLTPPGGKKKRRKEGKIERAPQRLEIPDPRIIPEGGGRRGGRKEGKRGKGKGILGNRKN